jgi:hypothetical protein
MNENILSFVKWGAGVAITLAIISIAMVMFNSTRTVAEDSIENINDTTKIMAESEYSIYNGNEVQGGIVSSCIEKYEGDYMAIFVTTGSSSTWYGYSASISSGVVTMGSETGNTISITKDVSSSTYINPNAVFDANIYRDANDVITAIEFIQQ